MKISNLFIITIVCLCAAACSTTTVNTAPVFAPATTEASTPVDTSDPTSWIHFSVESNDTRPTYETPVQSLGRNTLCSGATIHCVSTR